MMPGLVGEGLWSYSAASAVVAIIGCAGVVLCMLARKSAGNRRRLVLSMVYGIALLPMALLLTGCPLSDEDAQYFSGDPQLKQEPNPQWIKVYDHYTGEPDWEQLPPKELNPWDALNPGTLPALGLLFGLQGNPGDSRQNRLPGDGGHLLARSLRGSFFSLQNRLAAVLTPQQRRRSLAARKHGLAAQDDSSSTADQLLVLARQPDCSLTAYTLEFDISAGAITLQGSVPQFQTYLHTLNGLSPDTGGTWPEGCNSPTGAPFTYGTFLGPTTDGSALIGALVLSGDSNALYTGTVATTTGSAFNGTQITSVPNPRAVASIDLNGDGIKDLVVLDSPYPQINDPGGIYVLLGNGDGTFQSPKLYATGITGTAATIADVNGDGKPDLVVTANNNGTAASNGLAVLLGNGDGTFKSAVMSASAGGQYLAAGDFNGDGKLDLVFDTGVVQLGNGDGTFKASTVTLPGYNGGGMPAIADFNNDGKLDIALNQASQTITVYNGKGDGTFTTGHSYANLSGTVNLGAADLDGDGNMDLISGTNADGVYFTDLQDGQGEILTLLGNGDGSFQGTPAYPATAAVSMTGAFAVGDFNGDGNPDILGSAVTGEFTNNGLQISTGDGKGNFTPQAATGVGNPTLILTADMNGDKHLDAVIADAGTSVGVSFGNGQGGLGPVADYALPNGGTIANMVTGDFNGDGKPDVLLLATGSSNAIYLYLNKGDGTLNAPLTVDTPSSPLGLAVGDFNGDGKLDFVMTNSGNNSQGSMMVYLGKGDGTFQAPVSYSPGYSPLGVAVGDMNKDGKPDIVVTSVTSDFSSGAMSVYLGKGDGTFQAPVNTAMWDGSIAAVAIGDFNFDGIPDVAVADCCGDTYATVYFGKGDGTFPTNESPATASSAASPLVADLNNDGYDDLLMTTDAEGGAPASIITFVSQSSFQGEGATASRTILAASAATVASGAAETFTATVTAATGTGTPTGYVTFYDGTTLLGDGELSSSGVATYSASSLAAGTHTITAIYGSDETYAVSTSAAVTVTVTAVVTNPSFALTSSGNITVTAGATTGNTATISTTGSNGFSGAVSLSCAVGPMAASGPATCSLSPASVTVSGATAQTSTLTITTTATSAALNLPEHPKSDGVPVPWYAAGGTLACVLLFGIPARRRSWRTMLGMLILLAFLTGGLASCSSGGSSGGSGSSGGGGSGGSGGSGSSGNSGTTAGTYTVTVTGTSGSTMETTAVMLTVN